jgi:pimeloyl-ACP methyl ester carboxylesterase
MASDSHLVDRGDGVRLAARYRAGREPTLIFLPGYMSDMGGTKAEALWAHAEARGRACLLLDYSGCGQSEGEFEQGSIRRWAADVLAVADALAPGEWLPVGSSMGGWVMLHVALARPAQVSGLVGIAAAPDFTRWGLGLTAADRARLAREGFIERESRWGPAPYRYTRALLDDADGACLLDGPIGYRGPVRLLHGTADSEVPWQVSARLMAALASRDAQLTLVKDGDHRLSSPAGLALMARTVDGMANG